MDIGESKKVVDAMVETLSIGGLYKQNNELFEFCIMGHVGCRPLCPGKVLVRNLGKPNKVSQNVGTSHEMGTMACTWPTP
jgi:hypothetical protein